MSPCDSLGPGGAWEEIAPPEVSLDPWFETPAGDNYGAHSFVIDPRNTANVYLGTSAQGISKTADCGATWKKVNTGLNGAVMDGGRQWTFVIDPRQSRRDVHEHRLRNGWFLQIDERRRRLATVRQSGLRQGPAVWRVRAVHPHGPHESPAPAGDPHFECEIGQGPGGLPSTKGCILETKDAGATWRILEGAPPAGEGASQWMIDADTWLWSAYFDGMWRTANGGATWDPVIDPGTYSTANGVRVPGGKFYSGGVFTTLQSDDGASWSSLLTRRGPNSSPPTALVCSPHAAPVRRRGGQLAVDLDPASDPGLQQAGQCPHLGPAVRPRPSHPVLPQLHERLLAPRSRLRSPATLSSRFPALISPISFKRRPRDSASGRPLPQSRQRRLADVGGHAARGVARRALGPGRVR